MIYVVTLQVQLDTPLDADEAQAAAQEWADIAGIALDATTTGALNDQTGNVLRVAGRLDDAGPVSSIARRTPDTLGHLLDRHGVVVAEWLEVSVLSLAEHDRQGKARAVAASAS